MAIIIGKEKKNQRRVERSEVLKGMREARIEATRKKEEQKAAAAAEAEARESAKASKAMENGRRVRVRRGAVKGDVDVNGGGDGKEA